MASSLLWTDLSLSQLDRFYACSSHADSYAFLGKSFLAQNPDTQPFTAKQTILLDIFYHTLAFAKSLAMTPEQTSVLFSLMKQTHETAVSSPFVTFDQDYASFKSLLLAHSINRPPYSIRIFSLAQVQAISDWASQGTPLIHPYVLV